MNKCFIIIKLYQHNKWPIRAPSSYYKSQIYLLFKTPIALVDAYFSKYYDSMLIP